MARTLFPAGSPIGKHYGRGGPDHAGDIEVIGVVKDVKYNSLDEEQQSGDYLPYAQNERFLNDFEVRHSGDSGAMVAAIRQAIHDVDFTLPFSDVTTLDEQVAGLCLQSKAGRSCRRAHGAEPLQVLCLV